MPFRANPATLPGIDGRFRSMFRAGAILPVLLAILMPKCPICFAVLLAGFGVGISAGALKMPLLFALAVGCALTWSTFNAIRLRDPKALATGGIGAAFLLAGKLGTLPPACAYFGAALLTLAVLAQARAGRRLSATKHPCETPHAACCRTGRE